MIVRIGCTYSYDMDFNDYMFDRRLRTMGEVVIFSRRDAEAQRECKSPSVVSRSGIRGCMKNYRLCKCDKNF